MRRFLMVPILLGLMIPLRAEAPPRPATSAFQVPFLLTVTKHVVVRAKIDGQGPFHFLIDTGAPALYVTPTTCRKLRIAADPDGWGTFERFEIEGGAVIAKAKGRIEEPFQIEGMNKIGLAGVELHGIIGYNILARFRIELDFTRDWMVWTPLKFDPGLPAGLDGAAPAGVDALAGLAKIMALIDARKGGLESKQRGFLGVELAEDKGGVAIAAVLPDTPASSAGLQIGDRITHCQDAEVKKVAEIHRLAKPVSAGDTIRLTIRRGMETRQVAIPLGKGF